MRFNLTADKPKLDMTAFTTAAVKALEQTAANIVDEGRRNIAGAGRFGTNWQQGLKYKMQDPQAGLKTKAIVFHTFGLSGVFEEGITISGRPLLWIPTTRGAPSAKRSGKKLVAARIHGRSVLFDAADRDPHRKPLYIGVPVVRIEKRWRITEIAKEQVAKIGQLFSQLFKA